MTPGMIIVPDIPMAVKNESKFIVDRKHKSKRKEVEKEEKRKMMMITIIIIINLIKTHLSHTTLL
jgi:hypothetical protein